MISISQCFIFSPETSFIPNSTFFSQSTLLVVGLNAGCKLTKAVLILSVIPALSLSLETVTDTSELAVVKARLDANYNGDMSTSEEWLNAFHDAVVRGDLSYNETLGDKLGNWMYKNILCYSCS